MENGLGNNGLTSAYPTDSPDVLKTHVSVGEFIAWKDVGDRAEPVFGYCGVGGDIKSEALDEHGHLKDGYFSDAIFISEDGGTNLQKISVDDDLTRSHEESFKVKFAVYTKDGERIEIVKKFTPSLIRTIKDENGERKRYDFEWELFAASATSYANITYDGWESDSDDDFFGKIKNKLNNLDIVREFAKIVLESTYEDALEAVLKKGEVKYQKKANSFTKKATDRTRRVNNQREKARGKKKAKWNKKANANANVANNAANSAKPYITIAKYFKWGGRVVSGVTVGLMVWDGCKQLKDHKNIRGVLTIIFAFAPIAIGLMFPLLPLSTVLLVSIGIGILAWAVDFVGETFDENPDELLFRPHDVYIGPPAQPIRLELPAPKSEIPVTETQVIP
jgi:hypothetical protein